MKLSRKAIRIISDLTRQHMRIQSLSRAREVTPRAKYHFFQDLGKEGIDLVILALSNALALKRIEFSSALSSSLPDDLLKIKEVGAELLGYYYGEFSRRTQKPLLDGIEITKALGIPQGKAIGVLLNRLREAEISGKVQTREEALKFLKNIDISG